jgi:hypothetical protein
MIPPLPGPRPRLVNLAIKVADLDAAIDAIEALPGARLGAVHELDGDRFAEAEIGDTVVNIFTAALYEDPAMPLPPGPLHTSYAVEKLAPALADPGWGASLIWGPEVISGGFGRRRVAFFEPLPGTRVELMEILDVG